MEAFKTVRFSLRHLATAVARNTRDFGAPLSAVLDHYLDWAFTRGWSLVSVWGSPDPSTLTMATLERSEQRGMVSDEQITVVWLGGDELETPDYLVAYPVPDLSGFLVWLEDQGFELDQDRDGYYHPEGGGYIAGTHLAKLQDAELIRAGDFSILRDRLVAISALTDFRVQA